MSLVELIARADERGAAAAGVACLDRCIPLLGGDDEALRPLWASLAEGAADGDWAGQLEQVRGKLAALPGEDEAARLAHGMLAAAPLRRDTGALREWADACSVAALRIHRLLDGAGADGATDPVETCRQGDAEGLSPLLAAELRRQIAVLEVLDAHGPAGLRGALEIATEGRRVLRAAVSRRSRRDG
ncbi:hypothetical protein [Streptomyces sp. NPDC059515]|uniref:hypothetical protein n=1 Tax=Streptomyces sp. NPDC059515 TaxID=3346854 RepID=UPI00367CB9DD